MASDERAERGTAPWVEPTISDRAAFVRAHPETVVSAATLERLERRIRFLAATFEHDPAEREEVAAAIRLRIIEAATGSRLTDDAGRPIRDYLAQNDAYIVRHAAARVWAELRRERRAAAKTVSFRALVPADFGPAALEESESDPPIADPVADPLVELAADELGEQIDARISAGQRRVFRLLVAGLPRAEVARELGLDRRTVSDHVESIRRVARQVLAERGDAELLAEAAARSTYRRRLPHAA